MLDALQNHSARVVIVGEVRDAKEVEAARTIANQGVVLIASVHSTGLGQHGNVEVSRLCLLSPEGVSISARGQTVSFIGFAISFLQPSVMTSACGL